MSISHRVCAEISEESNIRKTKSRNRSNIARVVRAQTRKYHRSARNGRPHPYVGGNTTEPKSERLYGILKREKYDDYI